MGAAGRRYNRHFRKLGVKNIDFLRSGKSTIKEEIEPAPDNVYFDSREAFENDYDAMVIATPSSMHYEYIMAGIKNNINVLTEKPVSNKIEDLYAIKESLAEGSMKFAVCHNLRYHPAIKSLKEYVDSKVLGEPICASVQFCAYLPDWHPWEDYRSSYAAREELGGGAALTHIHEIDYLNWIFGMPEKYNGIKSPEKFIDTNVDECTAINLLHPKGMVSQVLLSLSTRPPKRNIFVYFTKGRLEIDLINNTIEFFNATEEDISIESIPPGFDFESTYSEMVIDFMDLIDSGSSRLCTIDEAITATEIVTEI